MKYANIILCKKPGFFDAPLTYHVPDELRRSLQVGSFVRVPLKERQVRGLVIALVDDPSCDVQKIRPVTSLDPTSNFPLFQRELAQFISHYFCTSLVRALRLMIPKRIWEGRPVKGAPFFLKRDNRVEKIPPLKSPKPLLLHSFSNQERRQFYKQATDDCLKQGKQVIFLFPEIALAEIFLEEYRKFVGDRFALFHSRLSDLSQAQEWKKVESGFARLIFGSRSAIFAPAKELQLIVIEAEQNEAYKQESSPYYRVHEVAEELARLTGAQLILGSPAPRIESYYKTKQRDYQPLFLAKPPGLPFIKIVDMREELRQRNFSIFSRCLQQKIGERLQTGEKIVLFLNQRGVARAMTCRDCGHTEACPTCGIVLKYHKPQKTAGKLLCHYCQFFKEPPRVCSECQSSLIKTIGIGTERVEEEVRRLFPAARLLRADHDTVDRRKGFLPLYEKFLTPDYEILIGTQLMLKGLSFHWVTLLGVVLADSGLSWPDFRSHERAFERLIALATVGKGEMILQTYQPDHPLFKAVSSYDYPGFAEGELKHRQAHFYPPFSDVVKLIFPQGTVVSPEKIESFKTRFHAYSRTQNLSLKILENSSSLLLRGRNLQEILNHCQWPADWRVELNPLELF